MPTKAAGCTFNPLSSRGAAGCEANADLCGCGACYSPAVAANQQCAEATSLRNGAGWWNMSGGADDSQPSGGSDGGADPTAEVRQLRARLADALSALATRTEALDSLTAEVAAYRTLYKQAVLQLVATQPPSAAAPPPPTPPPLFRGPKPSAACDLQEQDACAAPATPRAESALLIRTFLDSSRVCASPFATVTAALRTSVAAAEAAEAVAAEGASQCPTGRSATQQGETRRPGWPARSYSWRDGRQRLGGSRPAAPQHQ